MSGTQGAVGQAFTSLCVMNRPGTTSRYIAYSASFRVVLTGGGVVGGGETGTRRVWILGGLFSSVCRLLDEPRRVGPEAESSALGPDAAA
jgi:hypothetical protein